MPLVIPIRVRSAQLDLEAEEAVSPKPVPQEDGIAVVGFRAAELGVLKKIHSHHEMPGSERLGPGKEKKVLRKLSGEGNLRPFQRPEKMGQITAQVPRVVSLIDRHAVNDAIGIVKGNVEGRASDEGGKPRHGFGAALFVEGQETPR